jgi:hypothetical protein
MEPMIRECAVEVCAEIRGPEKPATVDSQTRKRLAGLPTVYPFGASSNHGR